MASKKQINQERKKELIAQLAGTRQSISSGRVALKEKFQVKKQLRQFVSRKPKAVFAGSVIAGLVLTVLIRRPRRSKKTSTTMSKLLLGWGLTLVKPAAKTWVLAKVKKLAAERVGQLANQRLQKPPTRDIEQETLEAL